LRPVFETRGQRNLRCARPVYRRGWREAFLTLRTRRPERDSAAVAALLRGVKPSFQFVTGSPQDFAQRIFKVSVFGRFRFSCRMIRFPAGAVLRRIAICLRWWSCGVFAVPRTECFLNRTMRSEHWGTHKDDFGCRTVARYEYMADRFLTRPAIAAFHQCSRKGGDKIRYDTGTNEFAVIAKNGVIRTYFKPVRCAALPPSLVGIKKCHNHPTHMEYVLWACAQ
jgi:hypothetical protein